MSTIPASDCASLFEAEGIELVVGGNTPVLLAEPDGVLYVGSGRVEIFSVAVKNGKPEGARRHFFTATEGDALFGMDLDRYGENQGFLAVGVVGTRLLKLSLSRVRAHLGNRDFGMSLASIVDRWVLGLSFGITRTMVPRADLQIDAGENGVLEDGGRVRARKSVAWVSQVEGASLFIGMEELVDLSPRALFPITPSTWLQARGPMTLTSIDTVRAIATDELWHGLDAFYRALFRCELSNTELAAADALNRLHERAERDRRIQTTSIGSLAAVLERRPSAFADMPGDDPLLAACIVVGRAMGIEMKAPPKSKDEEPKGDRLDAVLRAWRVRGRSVVLKGEWWTEESSPLLAFVEPDRRPVAILPQRRGSELHDPADRTRVQVTPAVAATLAPKAHSFYRPFPDRKLKPLDLLKFGLGGGTRDLLRPLCVGLAGGALAMFPPYFIGLLVDSVIPEEARNELLQIAIILGVVAITSTSFDIVRNLSTLRLESAMSGTVQPAMWDRLLALPIAFFRRFAAGDLAQRVATIDAIRAVLSGATISAVMTSVFSIFLLVQLFYYSGQLALVGAGLVLIAMAATMLAGYLKLAKHRDVMRIEGRISALVLQLLTGISKLRVAGAEGRAFAEWAREFAQKKKLALRTGMIESRLATFSSVFPVLSAMAIFWVLLTYVRGPGAGTGMSIGHFIAFNAAFGTFLAQMLQLSNAAMSVLLIVPLYERAKPILDALPEVDMTKADPGELTGRIDVDRVTFRYIEDGPIILNDLSIHITAGEYVAIVGPSGSGKSTLFRILLGLDVPESGSVYFDGRDLSQLDVAKTRRRMGVVMQTGKIRAGSIFENIVGSSHLTLEDAWEAARMAGFDQDIRQMPMAMQTMLQQGGLTLSGGQRQRLMIARAIIARPRILLFDEATSALDNRTQAIVSESLQRLQATRVAIAHRLSTIRGADRIYVLEAGRMVQAGSFDELSRQPGLFAELIRRQVA
jgi:ATP-binding cassette subfamily C protein